MSEVKLVSCVVGYLDFLPQRLASPSEARRNTPNLINVNLTVAKPTAYFSAVLNATKK